MTKIMAVTIVPILAVLMLASTNEGPRQDAKSFANDATHATIKTESITDLQRRRDTIIQRVDRQYERELIKERRARARARAEAQAEREAAAAAAAEAEREAEAEAATRAATRESAPTVSSGSVWDRLAQCESGGNWSYNGSSGYDGGLQFLPSTWTAVKPAGYPAYAWQASREQQIATAEILLKSSGWGAWPACSAELGL